MYYEEQIPTRIHADECLPDLFIWTCINNSDKRIKEGLSSLRERDTVFPNVR